MGNADEGIPMDKMENEPQNEVLRDVTDKELVKDYLEDEEDKKDEEKKSWKDAKNTVTVVGKKYGK